jgi:hypothetical protein
MAPPGMRRGRLGLLAAACADEGGPAFWLAGIQVTQGTSGLADSSGCVAGVEHRRFSCGGDEDLVCPVRELAGVLIGHGPQRRDDVAAARDAQGGSDGDGLVGYRGRALIGRAS